MFELYIFSVRPIKLCASQNINSSVYKLVLTWILYQYLLNHKLQSVLDKNFESRLVSLDFSAALDTVNHKGLIFKLKSVSVGGKILSIFI